jgi:hypothetical protein
MHFFSLPVQRAQFVASKERLSFWIPGGSLVSSFSSLPNRLAVNCGRAAYLVSPVLDNFVTYEMETLTLLVLHKFRFWCSGIVPCKLLSS